jgi:hypothetical protein
LLNEFGVVGRIFKMKDVHGAGALSWENVGNEMRGAGRQTMKRR